MQTPCVVQNVTILPPQPVCPSQRLIPQRSLTKAPPGLHDGFLFTFFFSLQDLEMISAS